MKKLISFILLVSTLFAQPMWLDPGLKVEYALTYDGTSYIFYSIHNTTLNNNNLSLESKYYRKNLTSGEEVLIFTGRTDYSGILPLSGVQPLFLSFSSEHPDSFYFAGQIVGDSTGAFIKGNGINRFYPNKKIDFFFASRQTPGRFIVKIDDFYKISNDHGLTFQMLHQIDRFLAISPFNDMEVLGLENGDAVRSTDGGINFETVASSWWGSDSVSGTYTQDSSFMLLTSTDPSIWYSKLHYSTQAGNPNTYLTALNWYFGTMHVIPYKSPSDSIYFYNADTLYTQPLSSANPMGQNISWIFDRRITGSAVIKGSTNLFISTSNKIYQKTGNSWTEVKSIDLASNQPDFYPLNTGDFWVYRVTGWWADPFIQFVDAISVHRVTRDTIVTGWGKYFVMDGFHSMAFFPTLQRRSENGKVYQLLQTSFSDTNHFERMVDDNTLKKGDISGLYIDQGYLNCRVSDLRCSEIFGKIRATRDLEVQSLYWYFFRAVDGIGITEAKNAFDFGETNYKLLGAYIDGMVYGDTTTTGIEDDQQIPETFAVSQNYPNPFNGSTKLSFRLPFSGDVMIRVFNILGQEVLKINPGYLPVGKNEVLLTMPPNLNSGVYLCRIEFGDKSETRKIIYLK